jgi:uncharacterized protein (UPF0261 family)
MKKLILLPLLILALLVNGCATTKIDPSGATVPMTKIEQAQDTATKTVLSLGEVLISAPKLLKTARQAGQLTKEAYNDAVDIYNQALASYTLLNRALSAAIAAGQDPSAIAGYTKALAAYMSERDLLSNIIAATGGA